MSGSRGSFSEKSTHMSRKKKTEVSSNSSSENELTSKPSHKKRLGKNHSQTLYPHVPDYFPMYTPPWATMNYIYLDLIRHLSLESELRTSLSKIDKSYSKDFKTKSLIEKEQINNNIKLNCKQMHLCCGESENSRSNLCLSCYQKFSCSSCGQNIGHDVSSVSKDIKPNKLCACTFNCCPTVHNINHIPRNLCHCHYLSTNHSCIHTSQIPCGSLNQVPIEIPVRETAECKKNTKKLKKSVHLDSFEESDSEAEVCNDKCSNTKCLHECNDQSATEKGKIDSKIHDDIHWAVPKFIGGTGDEGTNTHLKHSRKSQPPQSTAYFLPIGSLCAQKL